MKQAPMKLLVLAALLALSGTASAQTKGGKAAAGGGAAAGKVEDLGGDTGAGGKVEELSPDEKPATGGDTAAPAAGGENPFDVKNVICEANPEACQTDKVLQEYQRRELKDSQVYAVQQIYFLRRGRVDLSPYWGVSLNDQFVSHVGPGLALNYYITNVLAVGVNGNYFEPFNADADFLRQVRQGTRLAIPINEYQWNANLNFTYIPLYGKFAGFGDFIFHFDSYVVGGVGAISTRPKAVIDPEYRTFDFKPKVAFNVGLGLRVFFTRWLGAFLEVRDYIYNEELENTEVGSSEPERQNDSKWLGESRLTNAVQAQFGLNVFLPFSWNYRLPK